MVRRSSGANWTYYAKGVEFGEKRAANDFRNFRNMATMVAWPRNEGTGYEYDRC